MILTAILRKGNRMTPQDSSENDAELQLSITRTFDAAAQQVFNAWLDPEMIAKWLGPRPMVEAAETLLLEPRVGGRYRIQMRMPPTDTHQSNPTVGGTYQEIVRPSRLVFTWTWEDEQHETLVRITLKPVGKQTALTLLHENFAGAERRDSHEKGWQASLEQLARLL
jgi:uncharacterized protein YndB with AHSA1/START domain